MCSLLGILPITEYQEIYFIAIIDVLTHYGVKKQVCKEAAPWYPFRPVLTRLMLLFSFFYSVAGGQSCQDATRP